MKIVLGLSGGVDSAVAARLLQKQGYEVIGATILTGFGADVEPEARELARALGIGFVPVDVSAAFREEVVARFARDYVSGRTPNPCVLCNPQIKWKALVDTADALGADFVATGHYSSIVRLENGRYAVRKAPWKDQSYVLYGLSQEMLARTKTVLSGLTKEEVRAIAAEENLPVAQKPDSQEICFIPDNDHTHFIERFLNTEPAGLVPGKFVDTEGKVLGDHKGLIYYTVGQRKGLGIALGEPRFVVELKPETNEVVLGRDEDCFAAGLEATDLIFQGLDPEELAAGPVRLSGKIRYAHREAPCTVTLTETGDVRCLFDEPQRAITPGQAVVFYRDDAVAVGGTITKVVRG